MRERVAWIIGAVGLVACNLGVRSSYIARTVDPGAVAWASGVLISLTAAVVVLAGLRPTVTENRSTLQRIEKHQSANGVGPKV